MGDDRVTSETELYSTSRSASSSGFSGPVIVMGVSGCGKSSVGEGIAARLGAVFIEGDALHPAGNVEKMSKGIPLTDDDRWPWLEEIGRRLGENGGRLVLSCSALKAVYRTRLRELAGPQLAFVYLEGSKEVLNARMGKREGHFMPLSLLESQLATLESPRDEPRVVTVDIDQPVGEIVKSALDGLKTLG